MAVNIGGVMSKLKSYVSSPAGRSRIDSKLKSYRNGSDPYVNKTGKTYGGDIIITEGEMIAAANELISMVRTAAASAGLPASVMSHVESLYMTPPVINEDGSAIINIIMGDSPHRESLAPESYAGINNIVALFNNGYSAGARVYGEWHGRRVGSRQSREGLSFMQSAVEAFQSQYGSKYGVTVMLSSEYGGA